MTFGQDGLVFTFSCKNCMPYFSSNFDDVSFKTGFKLVSLEVVGAGFDKDNSLQSLRSNSN